jgi:flagellar biosynthesis/type III secretory pathway protein FliH
VLQAPILEARDEARELVLAAEAHATELIAEAEHAAEQIRATARESGRDEGLLYAQRLLVEIQQTRIRTLEGGALRRSVSELALEMTRRLLGGCWSAEPGTWARALLEAAAPLRRSGAISLRVAPFAGPAVRHALATEVASGMVDVVEDAGIDDAGCVAVSDCGRVDGRLSTMLAAFRGPLGLEDPV